jgi:hypothetical protein
MWAFTKSVRFWVARLGQIPSNLTLTASYGGLDDALIAQHQLKNVIVYPARSVIPTDRPVDSNDDYARKPCVNFALLDNLNSVEMIVNRYRTIQNRSRRIRPI